MNFKKWVKNIQTAGYNGAHTVVGHQNANQGLFTKDANKGTWLVKNR